MTTLKSIIEKNDKKPMEEYLLPSFKKLCHLQYRLDVELHTNKFIYNKPINICQDNPDYQYECFKPTDRLAGLINDLRSFIISFQKINSDNMQI